MKPLTRRPRRAGFTLIEVALSLIVFLMMTLMFAAVLPVAMHAGKMNDNYAQASFLAQHKIDQVRTEGFNALSSPPSPVVDATQPGGYPLTNADGSISYSFTTADSLTNYFGAGCTGILKVGADPNPSKGGAVAKDITVTIAWPAAGAPSGTYSLKAIVTND